jgi:hypothetical protein
VPLLISLPCCSSLAWASIGLRDLPANTPTVEGVSPSKGSGSAPMRVEKQLARVQAEAAAPQLLLSSPLQEGAALRVLLSHHLQEPK